MSNTLTTHTPDQIKNPILLAEHFVKSGYFKDTNDISKAVTKIVAGSELGFGPMASMAGFHIIQGKPTISSNLMGAAIKRSGKYNFKVLEISEIICRIEFFENKESCGTSTFTIEEARKAGTQNLLKYPKNMLYARALSNGAKWFCPDILNGSPIYTPEELGAEIDAEGEVINPEPNKTTPPPQKSPIEILKENANKMIQTLEGDEIFDQKRIDKITEWLGKHLEFLDQSVIEKIQELILEKRQKLESQIVNIEPNDISDEQLANFVANPEVETA